MPNFRRTLIVQTVLAALLALTVDARAAGRGTQKKRLTATGPVLPPTRLAPALAVRGGFGVSLRNPKET